MGNLTDGILTKAEALNTPLNFFAGDLKELGVIRSKGGPPARQDLAGLGTYEVDLTPGGGFANNEEVVRQIISDLGAEGVVFPIVEGDGQRVSGDSVTEADRLRARFGGEDEAQEVVDEMAEWEASSTVSTTSDASSGGLSTRALAIAGALVVGAIAVIGGS